MLDMTAATAMSEEPQYGPAMAALPEQRRRFVLALVNQTGRWSRTAAAREAGYSANSYGALRHRAYCLAHDERVIAGIQEETRRRLDSTGAVIGAGVLIGIANNPKESAKERRAAAVALLDRSGFGPMYEQRVTVRHEDAASKLERLKDLAALLGIDLAAFAGANLQPVKLIEHATPEGGGKAGSDSGV
jgi:hypothetical protein